MAKKPVFTLETNELTLLDEDEAVPQPIETDGSAEFASLAEPTLAKAAATEVVDEEIPEPLRGKSPKELARMYVEAQKAIGRQGQELGDLRRTADTYIKASLAARAPVAPAPVKPAAQEDVDFFAKPRDAVARAVAEHPAMKDLTTRAAAYEAREQVRVRESNTRQFNELHPDAPAIIADPAFQDWVTKSKVRQALLLRAHQSYDVDAGDEVFGTWKELVAARTPQATPTKAAVAAKRKADTAAAIVPSGGNASPGDSAGKGKVYRRADILRLMEDDPDRYDQLSVEIQNAYAEGRVR